MTSDLLAVIAPKHPLRRAWARGGLALGAGSILLAGVAEDQAPALDSLDPPGASPGSQVTVIARGRLEPWPVEIWTGDSGVRFQPGETNGHYAVRVLAEAAPGPRLVWAFNASGASIPRLFVVGDGPELDERALRNDRDEPRSVGDFPVTINGAIAREGEVDRYALELLGGRRLLADLFASRLDSPVQVRLTATRSDGLVVASAPISSRGDPILVAPVERPGRYELEVASGPMGSAALPAVYRLRLDVQIDTAPRPALESAASGSVEPPRVLRPAPRGDALTFPGTLRGYIDPSGDVDGFGFTASGGMVYTFAATAGSIGALGHLRLQIRDGSGETLAVSARAADPALSWVAPFDGGYALVLDDWDGGGGVNCPYEVELGVPSWHISATVGEHSYRLPPGGECEIPLTISRPSGFTGVLWVVPSGLPPGVTAAPLASGPGSSASMTLRLTAATDAPRSDWPFSLRIQPSGSGLDRTETAQWFLVPRFAPPGGLLINQTDQLWLTVSSASLDAGS